MVSFSHYFDWCSDQGSRDALFRDILHQKTDKVSGYYELPYSLAAVEAANRYLEDSGSILCDLAHMIIIGVGGSSLGLKAVDTMLCHLPNRKHISVKFLEHTDPLRIQKSLRKIELRSSLFVVISKSGTTVETTSLMKYTIDRYNLLDKHFKQRLLVITDCGSPLETWARRNGIYSITIPGNIGGRFCVLSAMGIVPLRILGYGVESILTGARLLSDSFFRRDEDHILDKAIFFSRNMNTYSMNVLFSYSSGFSDFNLWYVQLWGESLGKLDSNNRKVGLTPISLIGSIDQHSFLQLILQGKPDKTVTLLSIDDSSYTSLIIPDIRIDGLGDTDFVNNLPFVKLLNSQKDATLIALQREGIPVDSIQIDSLSEENVGALVFYYELLTSAVGCMFGINTYDQPAVEAGKSILGGILQG